MDGTSISDADLQRLNEKDKSELRSILNSEGQKAKVQMSMYFLHVHSSSASATSPSSARNQSVASRPTHHHLSPFIALRALGQIRHMANCRKHSQI